MEVYEIAGYITGTDDSGVNYLQPSDTFQNVYNGFINRQVLQSRQGFSIFGIADIGGGAAPLSEGVRVLGIFEHVLPDGSQELLGFNTERLYRWNPLTNVWDRIPFAGTMAAYTSFTNTEPDFYISGTSYSTSTNTQRFVFTGDGIAVNANGSAIFFYDGTDVKDFTNTTDNPNYAPPLYPITNTVGKLFRATYVQFFGERLNFGSPTISAADLSGPITYEQGILYSGIRSGTGNGDKFNVAGAGLIQADTYETLSGMIIRGQIIVLNFSRSNWVLEKTQDAFNPYFIRKIPSVLGTNAKFSAVLWDDTVRSMGKTGIISTDGRQSLRIDNKIPTFTREIIDQQDFNLTYGGFDRLNNQFLWAYKISESDTVTQNGVLAQNYEEGSWSIYDCRFSVFGQTDLGENLTMDEIDETLGNPSWSRMDTTEELWSRIGLGASVQKTLAGDDLGFIYELNSDFDDYTSGIQRVTAGATTTLRIAKASYIVGDLVVVQDAQGMTQLNNYDSEDEFSNLNLQPYTVLSVDQSSLFTTLLEIDVDSLLFSTYTFDTGIVSKIINFSAETIPFNPYRSIGRRCYISHVEFLLDCNGGNLLVSVFQDEQDDPYKDNVIIYPTSGSQNREYISMVVDNEANFHTFKLKQNSASVQMRLTSMRIHCQPGGLTSG